MTERAEQCLYCDGPGRPANLTRLQRGRKPLQDDDGNANGDRLTQCLPLLAQSGCVCAIQTGGGLIAGSKGISVVPRAADSLNKLLTLRARIGDVDRGDLGRKVRASLGNAGNGAKCPLHAGYTAPAGHSFDAETNRFRCCRCRARYLFAPLVPCFIRSHDYLSHVL